MSGELRNVDVGLAFDGVPVAYVHPADVDLPLIKAQAAERGCSVVASAVVQRGQIVFAPQGTLRFPEES